MIRWCFYASIVTVLMCPNWGILAQSAATQPGGTTAAMADETLPAAVPVSHPVSRDRGYRGLWWGVARPNPFMMRLLSGAVAFEPMDHSPVARYVAAADKTFFAYAATSDAPPDERGRSALRINIGSYDHKTGLVSSPVVLVDALPAGTRGCPVLSVDDTGCLWVFLSVTGAEYPSTIFRSAKPHEIDTWEKVAEMDFQQPQVWYVPSQGFMLLHVRSVEEKPRLHFMTSRDGVTWSRPVMLAAFGEGQTCISAAYRNKIGVAFTYGQTTQIDAREDLYYMETPDMGKTWQVLPRNTVKIPLTVADNPARVFDRTNWKFFLRDLAFDGMGNPVIFYHARHQRRSMPAPETRIWSTSRWIGREWESNGALFSDSDHDAGCIEVDKLVWYATIPTRPGPQPNSAGGEMVRWRSETQGRSWFPQPLTTNSQANHNYARRVMDAKPEMVVLWADGNTRKPSESHLYFADRAGNVYRLPSSMSEVTAKPELVWKAPEPATQPVDAASMPASAPF